MKNDIYLDQCRQRRFIPLALHLNVSITTGTYILWNPNSYGGEDFILHKCFRLGFSENLKERRESSLASDPFCKGSFSFRNLFLSRLSFPEQRKKSREISTITNPFV